MPVLRRPHDHHRDFRARMRAQVPAFATARGNQDRHLMMPSPAIYTYSNARHSRWLSASTAQARIAALHSIAVARPILSRYRRSLVHTDACDPGLPQADRGDRFNPISASPNPRQNPHSARGTAPAYVPRFRALALFGRRPQERVDSVVIPASKNLHCHMAQGPRHIRSCTENGLGFYYARLVISSRP